MQTLIEEEKNRDRNIQRLLAPQPDSQSRGPNRSDPDEHRQHRLERLRDEKVMRAQLERQQARRLEQLIEENRHLCAKVMEQKMRHSFSGETSQGQEEHPHRQHRPVPESYLTNLDISVIPLAQNEQSWRPSRHPRVTPHPSLAPSAELTAAQRGRLNTALGLHF
jgi:hypothetical protein